MLWTNIKRVVRAGFINFWRNGFVSIASILVMVITLSVISTIIFTNVLLSASLEQIKDKVDINVYFVTSTSQDDVLAVKKSLESLPEVRLVTYISKEQALADFKERHKNDQFTLQALDELQDNPLGATLNIKAQEPSQYSGIVDFLGQESISQKNGSPIIDKVNYNQNKTAIDKLTSMIDLGRDAGLVLTILLVTLSTIVTFNTIRLAIYSSREEISIMRLVGASSKYVRGPFVIVGIMYGVISALITTALFFPITYYLGRASYKFFGGVNIFTYYLSNLAEILLVLAAAGILVGAISSFLAVRRYLKI
jgi:cell division transport system permease protein